MGATSPTQVANLALAELGSSRISDINDANSKGARECLLHYDISLRATLRRHRWNFAIARKTLTELAEAPDWGYEHQFPVPSDFVRLSTVNDVDVWESGRVDWFELEGGAEGRRILVNSKNCRIKYVYENKDTTTWDDLFVKLFALQLAIDCCRKITGSDTKKHRLKADLEDVDLPTAMQANSAEAHSGENPPVVEALQNSLLVRARGAAYLDEYPEGPDAGTLPLPGD